MELENIVANTVLLKAREGKQGEAERGRDSGGLTALGTPHITAQKIRGFPGAA